MTTKIGYEYITTAPPVNPQGTGVRLVSLLVPGPLCSLIHYDNETLLRYQRLSTLCYLNRNIPSKCLAIDKWQNAHIQRINTEEWEL